MNEEIEVTIKIPYQRISDLLCNAFEGGSNYWYEIVKYIKPDPVNLYRERDSFGNIRPEVHKHLYYPLSKGGALLISAPNDKKGYRLDLDAIHRGIQTMMNKYPAHFANVINETDDAYTGDVFLQCCLFGELVYG